MKFSTLSKRAFTLIELLIVITIIGILAVALVPKLTGGTARARDAQRKTDLQQIATALEFYADDHGGVYPTPTTGNCASSSTLGTATTLGSYLTTFPSDPSGTGISSTYCSTGYMYFPVNTAIAPTGYLLGAQIETNTDTSAGMYLFPLRTALAATSSATANFTGQTACTTAVPCADAVYIIGR